MILIINYDQMKLSSLTALTVTPPRVTITSFWSAPSGTDGVPSGTDGVTEDMRGVAD